MEEKYFTVANFFKIFFFFFYLSRFSGICSRNDSQIFFKIKFLSFAFHVRGGTKARGM